MSRATVGCSCSPRGDLGQAREPVPGGPYAGAMTCTVCGEPLPDDARFCPNCGTVVGSSLGTEERKLVTVLFADLVESTALSQRLDPERAREVLGRFYDAVTEELRALRGQPEKFIGDAVMAVFGLPHVHEDDAARAVRAGLAIRGHTRRLAAELGLDQPLDVRVGVETGEAATGVGPSGQLLVTGSGRERGRPPADRRSARRGTRRRHDVRAHRARGLVRRPARRGRQGVRGAARRLPGRRTHARERRGARSPSSGGPTSSRSCATPTRGSRRRRDPSS